jgi:hypothetical protein
MSVPSHRIYFVDSGIIVKKALDYGCVTILSSYVQGTISILPCTDIEYHRYTNLSVSLMIAVALSQGINSNIGCTAAAIVDAVAYQ